MVMLQREEDKEDIEDNKLQMMEKGRRKDAIYKYH